MGKDEKKNCTGTVRCYDEIAPHGKYNTRQTKKKKRKRKDSHTQFCVNIEREISGQPLDTFPILLLDRIKSI